ncbi:MAG: glycosyltransferase family 4 protein [Gemmatimonadota bacterium]|nr:glycosyltransferase family 4 protein [Gemmatimonadota bacterium]
MNILTFNYEYPPIGGGGGVVHALIAEELARRHRVFVVTSAAKGLPRREERAGTTILRVPVIGRQDMSAASLTSMLTYPPGAWVLGGRLIRRERIDIVHSHFAVPTGPGSLPPSLVLRVPHVLSLHGGDIYDPSKRLSPHRLPIVRSAVRWTLRRSAAVVAQSKNTRENARRWYGHRGPIELIPLGIRQPTVPAVSRAELGLPESAFLGITVGRLVKRKALDVLIRALTSQGLAGVHLIVVGDGPERSTLEALGTELGLGERLRFAGRVSEERKWQLLQAADAYLSTTMHEGFGLVYLEAMAAGIPVVTFDHGGQVDFLREGETGYVVPAGDVEQLVSAIAKLVANPAEKKRMGETNRQLAPRHNIEECAARYEELFSRLLQAQRGNAKARS